MASNLCYMLFSNPFKYFLEATIDKGLVEERGVYVLNST